MERNAKKTTRLITYEYGFTLTELMITLFIMSLVIAVLLPALAHSRQKTRITICSSQLGKLSGALRMYIADNDGVYPPPFIGGYVKGVGLGTAGWGDLILPYIAKSPTDVPVCPEVKEDMRGNDTKFRRSMIMKGYCYNKNLSRRSSGDRNDFKLNGQHEASLSRESLVVAIFDARPMLLSMVEPDSRQANFLAIFSRKNKKVIASLPVGATRHGGGANYAFADGHVSWLKPEQIAVTPISDGKRPGFGL